MKSRVSALVLLTVGVVVSAMGCATTANESEEENSPIDAVTGEEVANEETVDSTSSAAVACPAASTAKLQQTRATHLLRYILGGTVPSGVVPSSCTGLVAHADAWRNAFAQGKTSTWTRYRFKDARVLSPTTICGLTTTPVQFQIWARQDDYSGALANLIHEMNRCFGNTVELFAHIRSSWTSTDPKWTQYGYATIVMDPETAQYTASLGTTNGASASATLLSSGTRTYGWRLPCATCTPYYRSSIPIGAPCTSGTTSVVSGTKTNFEAIQPTRMWGYRRCGNGTIL